MTMFNYILLFSLISTFGMAHNNEPDNKYYCMVNCHYNNFRNVEFELEEHTQSLARFKYQYSLNDTIYDDEYDLELIMN